MLMRKLSNCFAAALFLFLAGGAQGAEPDLASVSARLASADPASTEHVARGLVTGVADGDTAYVEVDGVRTRVRLAQIDAPEKAQAFGKRSEASLREMIWKRVVVIRWKNVDRYGRPIVAIQADGVDVNAEQVKRGMAWVYRAYSHDPVLVKYETAAREARAGLWAEQAPIAPWDWRRKVKGE